MSLFHKKPGLSPGANPTAGNMLLNAKQDRRILPDVPDPSGQRSAFDRRGLHSSAKDLDAIIKNHKSGTRYPCHFPVEILCRDGQGKKHVLRGSSRDISLTGLLLCAADSRELDILESAGSLTLRFRIPAGTLPEGYEMKVRIGAHFVRRCTQGEHVFAGLQFSEDLSEYALRHKDRHLMRGANLMLLIVSLLVVLMHCENVIYYKYNALLFSYSIAAAVFLLSRYAFGALYRPVKIDPEYTPSVTIVIPCFNEEQWISRTIRSCMNQYYPTEKLEVIVVDDCSTDRSGDEIRKTIAELSAAEDSRLNIRSRLFCLTQEKNAGKRDALCRGVEYAKGELVVFVDSDSFLDPYAIVHLVQPFRDPRMGGVTGRTDVANLYTNWLTRIQAVRYYIAFRIMKASEALFDTVTCLSGPLSCYRRDLVLRCREEWLNQKFLGHKATFGDDRSLTNLILKHHRTFYQDTAVCATVVPCSQKVFLKQQMRWKRSWLRESLIAGTFMWRKEPIAALNFYIGLLVPILSPVVVAFNLIYVPLSQHIFPTTFFVGLILMSMMMSFTQLFYRKSSTWYYGFLFCLYYEAVLLWQMPIAWLTFWKSTWGTRMTANDVLARNRKRQKNAPEAEPQQEGHANV